MRGLELLLGRLERTKSLLPGSAISARDACARQTLERAGTIVSVRTGRLRDSLTAEGGRVFTRCEYALYVELGTVRTDARPYLLPALDAPGYLAAAEQAWKEVL